MHTDGQGLEGKLESENPQLWMILHFYFLTANELKILSEQEK